MGLAGPRNRTKIGADPRNTKWSNNTDRFGHRILTTLGWQPGNTLGDTSSLYHQSGHITAASAAGVKIVLKDDNLGIGCNKRQREDECIGLDGLQSLLGRLNGKGEEELEKEAGVRDRMKKEIIVGERYGMKFVRGETYVSSDIETLIKRIEGEKKEVEVKGKGKTGVENEDINEGRKKRKKSGIKQEETETSGEVLAGASDMDSLGEKEKVKHEKSSLKLVSVTPASSDNSGSNSKKRKWAEGKPPGEPTKDKKDKISKKSKNGETHEQRKERRAREKKEKEARKAEKKKSRKTQKSSSSDSLESSENEPTPTASGTATPSGYAALVGRQAVRHRYIAAKRSAVMDAKALNEIFMIKA